MWFLCNQTTFYKYLFLSAVKNKEKGKTIIILPVIFKAVGAIINVGAMAAIGYFSNDRNLEDKARVASKAGAAKTTLKHLNPAATAIYRVCIAMLPIRYYEMSP